MSSKRYCKKYRNSFSRDGHDYHYPLLPLIVMVHQLEASIWRKSRNNTHAFLIEFFHAFCDENLCSVRVEPVSFLRGKMIRVKVLPHNSTNHHFFLLSPFEPAPSNFFLCSIILSMPRGITATGCGDIIFIFQP